MNKFRDLTEDDYYTALRHEVRDEMQEQGFKQCWNCKQVKPFDGFRSYGGGQSRVGTCECCEASLYNRYEDTPINEIVLGPDDFAWGDDDKLHGDIAKCLRDRGYRYDVKTKRIVAIIRRKPKPDNRSKQIVSVMPEDIGDF